MTTKKLVTDEDVLALCEEVWKFRLDEGPEMATFCGFHDYDDRWDDISEEGYLRKTKCIKEFLDRAQTIDVSRCSYEVSLSQALLVDDLQVYLEGNQFKAYLMAMNNVEGVLADSTMAALYGRFETEADFEKYILRLERLPKRIQDTLCNLKKGVEQGIVLHMITISIVPEQIQKLLAEDVDSLNLMRPFKKQYEKISSNVLQMFQDKARQLIKTKVLPAFAQLKQYLEEEYFKSTRPHEGVSALPNGQAWYQACLKFYLNCDMTAQEVYDLGLSEVKRIKAQILKLAAQEGLGDNMQDILKSIEKKQGGFFQTEEEVLDYVRDLCQQRIRPHLTKVLKEIPDIDMVIAPYPAYRSSGPLGFYNAGLPDGSRKGTYHINTKNVKEVYPYLLPALSLHEGEPGHHIQMSLALLAKDLPSFRRYAEGQKYFLAPAKYPMHGAYNEGWGLYAEYLGEEMKIYKDNYEMLGRYSFEIFRAARLVVDTGIHAFGWTSEQAVQYLVENSLMLESELRAEVVRYIRSPAQACAYKIGELKILEFRRKAEKALGDKFDLREFHHCLLIHGRVPLNILEIIVDDYIRTTKEKS